MMSIVEKRIPIEYVLMGTFESEVIKRENTISKFSQLGYTRYRNWISLDNRYMVVPLNENVKCRTVVQRNGLCHYIIDLSSNPTGVELSTGGIYDHAENVLIAGRIAVFTAIAFIISFFIALLVFGFVIVIVATGIQTRRPPVVIWAGVASAIMHTNTSTV